MEINIDQLKFDTSGLIPAIVQDAETGKVLTLAYMNEESLNKTIETTETWFFSRSRLELWNKGETSGNKQEVKKIAFDCDADALLVQVKPLGPACHTGEETCFNNDLLTKDTPSNQIVSDVVAKIKQRRENPTEGSYTAYLFEKGMDKILKKIGEETSEVLIGAKNNDKAEVTSEIADLTYHTLVLMELMDVSVGDIKNELKKRHIQKEGQEK
ncbi:bifunctional phosphoribosyl-AMP cyclohydrolase/phosphoribosyl-ATP diphosphatase HisIE [Oceanobacillus sp. 143]|uniref:Histidine biosynthesis bifunctional protein HisIE n=1 Tax=Oceanobacillus zhaokaii TaxID=2052660 RepID=A0A345PD80_9BACI|nr:bifunctional phosphoribosyl-AMP cyclohydrolase/phosphoribosyl-ATP diphosphatase HisIE [Oceanobacillus zhaokaii]AXI07960.1 bifunctional phosphoribosyl-AMP cyclohydrolase/phosphoribosyl-ATP pyrophosphatase [Oceanobacillus zhaokaii]QGS68002.1 bifunctional phosphoribosyl-AMP cyclohydrolase/phosphoribosyl-ATP diphosphatase HisIE [Oceanobacillus sp. 143]